MGAEDLTDRARRATEQLATPVRKEDDILFGKDELGRVMGEGVTTLREAGATDTEIVETIATNTPLQDVPPLVLGVPITAITGFTLDGRNWVEVMGEPFKGVMPGGGVFLECRVAQAPGGKARKFGMGQGDTITVRVNDIKGVQRIACALSVCGECGSQIGHDHEPDCQFEGRTYFSQTVKRVAA